jgi:hypothetical protein
VRTCYKLKGVGNMEIYDGERKHVQEKTIEDIENF